MLQLVTMLCMYECLLSSVGLTILQGVSIALYADALS